MDTGSVLNRLDLVFYWVSDLDRSVAFYRDVLGLSLLRLEAGKWAEFDAGGCRFAVHAVKEGQPVRAGGAAAVFAVDDLDWAQAALRARGVRFGHEGAVEGYGRFASFADPDGNEVQIIEYAREPDRTSS